MRAGVSKVSPKLSVVPILNPRSATAAAVSPARPTRVEALKTLTFVFVYFTGIESGSTHGTGGGT